MLTGPPNAEAGVVDQHDEDVRRAGRRPDRLRVDRLRSRERALGGPGERGSGRGSNVCASTAVADRATTPTSAATAPKPVTLNERGLYSAVRHFGIWWRDGLGVMRASVRQGGISVSRKGSFLWSLFFVLPRKPVLAHIVHDLFGQIAAELLHVAAGRPAR